ncbi:MAG: hypothetical protein GVY26_06980 [Bacteroidetes bacterium]|nr:hypothetical protein [Bacteroidota bacterium]
MIRLFFYIWLLNLLLHIKVECVVSPAAMVESKTVTETSTTIKWAEEGTATISVTATNTCSGLTTTESLTVEIED